MLSNVAYLNNSMLLEDVKKWEKREKEKIKWHIFYNLPSFQTFDFFAYKLPIKILLI